MTFDPIWDKIHKQREWGRYPKEELVRWVARNYYAVKNRQEVRFLDLGCGAGASSWFLQREGFTVVPLDGSQAAVGRAGRGVVADAINLPFAEASFDCVIDIVCLAHNSFASAQRILADVQRVLKPGGKMFSMMPTAHCWKQPFGDKGQVIFLKKSEVEHLFKANFRVSIDWTGFSSGSNTVEHWLINAVSKLGA